MLSQDVKIGSAVRLDGKIYFCIDFQHVKPGKGNTIMRIKLKDVMSGNVLEKRFDIGVKLEDVRVEHRPYQYLYKEGEDYIFMHTETYEQLPIEKDLINNPDLLKEGQEVEINYDTDTDTPLTCELPPFVDLEVIEADPGVKGDTATNSLKRAVVETGADVYVPLFINVGEKIKVDTRTNKYSERVKE